MTISAIDALKQEISGDYLREESKSHIRELAKDALQQQTDIKELAGLKHFHWLCRGADKELRVTLMRVLASADLLWDKKSDSNWTDNSLGKALVDKPKKLVKLWEASEIDLQRLAHRTFLRKLIHSSPPSR